MLASRYRRWGRPTLFLTALVAALAFVLPASASATEYLVNTTADEPDSVAGAPCNTAAGKCSLRAAIEVSNSTVAVPDEIKFASDPFNGENGDTISTATPMPTIIDQVDIRGGWCPTGAGVQGPCAGVIKAGVGLLLVVEADNVEIQGLALNGGSTAINVINASHNFTAKGNWIGFDITGAASGNGTGIFIDPGSNGATIGGLEPAERNVIGGNANTGLDIEGASGATIQGNYFGVTPKGDAAAGNPKNIEITDSLSSPGFKAEDTEVGATLSVPATASAACDGGCNVISGGGTGVDLAGNGAGQNEAPASGPTTVHGNFIGLNAAGNGVLANGTFDVLSGAAKDVLIGGSPSSNSNWIAGGGYGIYHENGDDFEAIGNVIGKDATGAAATPPSSDGIFAFGLSSTDSPVLAENQISMAGGTGIENRFRGAEIIDNTITGAFNGILIYADNGGVGNIVEGNAVRDSTNSSLTIENDQNEVFGNEFEGSDFSTIFIKGSATENRIGGDTPASENFFVDSEYNPIAIITTETTQNEVARNRGEENALSGGGFIFINKASGAEPNLPNGNIGPPAISTALQSSGAGTAEPEAKVRVFRKATEFGGELESFLGETVADEGGNWKVTYPAQIPAGTFVAATQTNTGGGTSEVAYSISAADPSGPPVPEDGGKGGGGTTEDKMPPETKIAKKPKLKGTPTAKFKFSSSEAGSSFECKLDKKPFKKCRSPKTYKKLKPGKHVFKVRAIDAAGNADPSPAKKKFKVKP